MYLLLAMVTAGFLGMIAFGLYYELRQPGVTPPSRVLKPVVAGNLMLFAVGLVGLLFFAVGEVMAATEETEAVRDMTQVSLGYGMALLGIGLPTGLAAIAASGVGKKLIADIAAAIYELSCAGGHQLDIHLDRIPVLPVTDRVCRLLDVDPLGLIGSGSLLMVCRPDAAEALMAATVLGRIGDRRAQQDGHLGQTGGVEHLVAVDHREARLFGVGHVGHGQRQPAVTGRCLQPHFHDQVIQAGLQRRA